MSSTGTPVVTANISGWLEGQRPKLMRAIENMCASIVRGAQANAPVDTGALRDSGRVEIIESGYQASFGGESEGVAYARIWELGDPWHLNPYFHGHTRDGRDAPLYYLKNAGNAVVERGIGAYL